jgi:hypothetical protein
MFNVMISVAGKGAAYLNSIHVSAGLHPGGNSILVMVLAARSAAGTKPVSKQLESSRYGADKRSNREGRRGDVAVANTPLPAEIARHYPAVALCSIVAVVFMM